MWSFSSATPEWTEGQVELRTVKVEEKYANWKINMKAFKPGDMAAFVAVDDFAFHISDICETMPPAAGAGTTTGPETTSNPAETTLMPPSLFIKL